MASFRHSKQVERPLGVTPEEWREDEPASVEPAMLATNAGNVASEAEEEHDFLMHETALTLVALTSVVYAYGEEENGFELHKEERLDAFMQRVQAQEGGIEIGDFKMAMLELLQKRAPDAKVVDFISLEDDGDVQVGVCCSEDQRALVVTFRGSESTADWLTNAMIFKTDIGEGFDSSIQVHRGFQDQLRPAYDRIVAMLRTHQEAHPDFRMHITGHSLGGALATLFGFRVAREWPEQNFQVTSVAAPRVGNGEFVEALHAQENLALTRITNAGDVVTAIPMIGYQHAGDVIRMYDDRVELFDVDGDFYNTWWEFSLFRNIQIGPHLLDEYYEKMKRLPW